MKNMYILALSLYTLAFSAQDIIFRDTVNLFVLDSIVHDIGVKEGVNKAFYTITKHFKYIGTDSITATRAFKSDPYYICEYPRSQQIIPNQIYPFKICMIHRIGTMNKSMGIRFSNGKEFTVLIKGEHIVN